MNLRTSLGVLCLLVYLALPALGDRATGRRGIAATVDPLATRAAIRAFERGGNAVDAAVAAALTLGVVDGHNSGLGGGCLMLIHKPDGTILALDGRETAPAAATADMFLRNGRADTRLSQAGALAAGVPGSLAVYDLALKRAGKLSLADHLLQAAVVAEEGFVLSRSYVRRIQDSREELARFPDAAALFLDGTGKPRHAGYRLIQRDLAATYRSIALEGTPWFYGGRFAQLTEVWMRAHGGLLTAADFAAYEVREREPIRSTYRGFDIVGFPPPSSGGIHVAQVLNLVERFDLRSMGPGSAEPVHLLAEAMKLAFADRAHWLGDSDFVPVPLGLASKAYAAQLGAAIDPARAAVVASHGEPPGAAAAADRKHTTHFSTADREGTWVACTATVNTSFGSKVVVPGTGVVLNNQMDDFAIQPGVTNFFGLAGSTANAVAARKRPLSSMSPTLVLKDGRPVLAVGAAGGPTIITQVILALVGVIDFDLELPEAIARTRFHHQWRPEELKVEKRMPSRVRAALQSRGHRVVETPSIGAAQGVGVARDGRRLLGAADPRTDGRAAGW